MSALISGFGYRLVVSLLILQFTFFVLLARFAGGSELMRFSLIGHEVAIGLVYYLIGYAVFEARLRTA